MQKLVISHYSEYIKRFLLPEGLKGSKSPGEHHFVAVYLLPRLLGINNVVPDYLNPDGTKNVIGDIVYFKDGQHHFGIEVKYETIRLTKNEYNNWIVNEDESGHPEVFIGIDTSGIIILSWSEFRDTYLELTKPEILEPISKGYGPQKRINVLFREGAEKNGYIPKRDKILEAENNEKKFIKLLKCAVSSLTKQ